MQATFCYPSSMLEVRLRNQQFLRSTVLPFLGLLLGIHLGLFAFVFTCFPIFPVPNLSMFRIGAFAGFSVHLFVRALILSSLNGSVRNVSFAFSYLSVSVVGVLFLDILFCVALFRTIEVKTPEHIHWRTVLRKKYLYMQRKFRGGKFEKMTKKWLVEVALKSIRLLSMECYSLGFGQVFLWKRSAVPLKFDGYHLPWTEQLLHGCLPDISLALNPSNVAHGFWAFCNERKWTVLSEILDILLAAHTQKSSINVLKWSISGRTGG